MIQKSSDLLHLLVILSNFFLFFPFVDCPYNFEEKMKIYRNQHFWDTLLIVIIWVCSVLQFCWIFSFLVAQLERSDLAHSWSDCLKVRRKVEGQGGIKRIFAIVPLSSILYIEFGVQILVPPSGLKDGSNNIPHRILLSMFLFFLFLMFLRCGAAMLILHSTPLLRPFSDYLEESTESLDVYPQLR